MTFFRDLWLNPEKLRKLRFFTPRLRKLRLAGAPKGGGPNSPLVRRSQA
jgi:hypothetical protein